MTHQPFVPTDKANQFVGSVLFGSSNCEAAHIHGIKPWTADRIVKHTVRPALLCGTLAPGKNLLSHIRKSARHWYDRAELISSCWTDG